MSALELAPRAAWRAREADPVHRIVESVERRAFVVHWLGPAPTPTDPAARLRQAQSYHLDFQHWADIGYNLAVGLDGSAWEARGWDAVGAHAPSFNRSAYGCVVLMGEGELLTLAATNTLAGLYHDACDRAGVRLTLLDHGGTGRSTSCAGPQLRALVELWRAAGVPTHSRGAAGDQLVTAPKQDKPGPPLVRAPTFPGFALRDPTRGSAVQLWQRRMVTRGWRLAADGHYGPASARVCRAFQAEKRLQVDGVVGPITWAATWSAAIT